MFIRILISNSVYVVLLLCVCHSEGRIDRFRRDHTDTHTDGSKTVGDMVSNFLASMFGPNTNLTDVANTPLNDSSKQALQSYLTNVSQSLTNGQADQQEVTSQENKTSTTTVSTTSTTTSTSSSSSPSTWMFSSSASPGYQIEDDRCYTDAVLQNFCPVPKDMTDVSFWELYSVFFSDSVLDALVVGCSKGSWCLKDRFDYWESLIVERVDRVMNSEIASSMCLPQIVPCVLNVASSFYNCSMYGQMVFTSEVLKLICGLKENSGLTSECYKHVISALHVTLADIMRAEEKEETGDFCEAPEAQMTQGLICVENSCPSESKTFHSFKPWAWFTSVVNDLIADCNMDRTTCKALLTPPQAYEMGAMVGISVAVMITALTLTIVVCTCYKRHRRNTVVKEGYQRLLTDGDES